MNYFLFHYSNKFPELILEGITEQCKTNTSNLTLVYHNLHNQDISEEDKILLNQRYEGYRLTSFADIEAEKWENAEKVILLSINGRNKHCYEVLYDILGQVAFADKVWTWITDDEVFRLYRAYGLSTQKFKIAVGEKSFPEWVFDEVVNYTNFYEPWGRTVEGITGKKKNFDNQIPIVPLKKDIEEKKTKPTTVNKRTNNDITRILVHTKGGSLGVFEILLYIALFIVKSTSFHSRAKISIYIWPLLGRYNLIFKIAYRIAFQICRILNTIFRGNVFIIEEYYRAPKEYTRHILSFDFLVAQKRGGGSTIRTFIKSGGNVFFHQNSFNSKVYSYNIYKHLQVFTNLGQMLKSLDSFDESTSKIVLDEIIKLEARSIKHYRKLFFE